MRSKEEIFNCLELRYKEYEVYCKHLGIAQAQEKCLGRIEDLRWTLDLPIMEYTLTLDALKKELRRQKK